MERARTVRKLRRRRIPTAVRLVGGLGVLILLGTLLFLLPGVATRPLAGNEALFTATSALAVTGLSIIVPGRDLNLTGQVILLLLIQVGGVGFMSAAVVILRLLGRRISLADRLALRDSLGLLEPRAILNIAGRVFLTSLAIQGAGAALLWLSWRQMLGNGRALFYAIFHATSAFCNAGFELFTGTPGYTGGIPTDPFTLGVFAGLIILGGLGIPVLSDLFWQRGKLTLHTKITFAVYAGLIGVGWLGILLAESRLSGTMAHMAWFERISMSLFQSISARTAGFAALAGFEQLTPASQWLIMALMLIGSAPASMGGGITTGTFAVLTLSLWAYAQGQPVAQIGGRSIGTETVRRAGAVLTVSLFVVGIATWLILMTHRTTLDTALFEVVSAFATTGLSLAFTDQLNLFGQLVIIFVMFWGRLGALTIVAALAQTAPPQPVAYPEAQVLIG